MNIIDKLRKMPYENLNEVTIIGGIMPSLVHSIPHLIVCSIISLFFLKEIIWIFVFGWIFADIIPMIYILLAPVKTRQNNYPRFKNVMLLRKTAHYSTIIISLVFLYFGYFGVFLAGVSHLILDYFGY